MTDHKENELEQIAIIGLAGRFPGAGSVDQFWQNLRSGKNCVTPFSDAELMQRGVTEEELADPGYVKAGLVLDNIDLFDADFFGYNGKDAEVMDPQQRIFLEIAWEALENAGCNPDTFRGSIGVFGGSGPSDYLKRFSTGLGGITSGFDSFQAMLGNDLDFLTTRVSYKLNLTGPSFALQTACSTSLVAVHVACQHLLTYQCDIALAGGVSIRLPQGIGYIYRDGMIWSPDGFCRAFDAKAQGTIFGRGAGIVVLKRLSEAIEERDFIHAVIKSSAVNNDGSLKVGFTAPSVEGQYEVIATAQALSETAPDTIGYIETHGTATRLGDPIEIEALSKAFRTGTDRTGFCGIGSVKTNIGHLDVAAGIAGLIKTTLALEHGEIPPSLHFERPNPNIDFNETPFYVVDRLQPWKKTSAPRRAGVSSFGIGGTNAHVIMEEAPPRTSLPASRSSYLLALSAKSQDSLQRLATNLSDHFVENPDISLADTAYTLHTGRKHFEHRRFAVCGNVSQAAEVLAQDDVQATGSLAAPLLTDNPVFMFSGQGSQYVHMCRELYDEESYFREQVDICAENLLPHLGADLRGILFPDDEEEKAKELINQTYITQPALFVVEYSLARLLMQWGIHPKALVGHSIGEYVAACLAGVFSLQDALGLVASRGKMMQDLEKGSMLAVPLSEEETIPLLPGVLSIAVINAPRMTVVSGETPAIEAFKDKLLAENGIEGRLLHTSHAFHSTMMEPIVQKFTQLVASIDRNTPEIPFASNLTGGWITEEQAVSADYWAQHLRQTVRFYSCLTTLMENGYQALIEVGPGQVLTQLAKQHPGSNECLVVATTRRPVERKDDLTCLLNGVGQLWVNGIEPDWNEMYRNDPCCKIPLPAYPFKRKKYWIGPPENMSSGAGVITTDIRLHATEVAGENDEKATICGPRNDLELQIAATFSELLGIGQVDVHNSFFDIGGDSLLAAQLLSNLGKSCECNITLADIFENPSVEALAELIKRGGGKLHSSVLPLNKGSGEQLVYFVVGINIYHDLAKCLSGTARCFGTFLPIEESLFDRGADRARWTVSELAAAYRGVIRNHSQGKPLSLVGVSFGGVVAYELARQLTGAGQSVPLLVMLDSLLPSGMRRNYIKWVAAHTNNILQYGFGPTMDKLKRKLPGRTASQVNIPPAVSEGGDTVPDQRLIVYTDAVERFEAEEHLTTYDGRTLLISARDAERFPGYEIDSHFGWKKHITGPFFVDSAPGDHLGLLRPPNVEVTASIIENILRNASD